MWGFLTLFGLFSILGYQVARPHWSTACDPGLARFNYMKTDPAVQARPSHAIVYNEVDQPDNTPYLVCVNTRIDFYAVGIDNNAVYRDLNQILVSDGWSNDTPGYLPDFELYQKQTPNGKWTADVRKDGFWTEMSISDEGGPAATP